MGNEKYWSEADEVRVDAAEEAQRQAVQEAHQEHNQVMLLADQLIEHYYGSGVVAGDLSDEQWGAIRAEAQQIHNEIKEQEYEEA